MVIVGIQLNREHEVSDLSVTLENLSAVAEKPHFLARVQSAWPVRAKLAFRRGLRVSTLESFLLRDIDDGFPFFTTRFYWDGVWFRITDTPLDETLHTYEQKEVAAGMHEVLICALQVLSCYVEMKERNVFISNEKSGVNGCRWCHEAVREFLELQRAHTSPIRARTITIDDARAAINLVLQVCFLVQQEIREHKEQHFADPLKSIEFVNYASRLLLWIGYFKIKYDDLRFILARQRLKSTEKAQKVWESLMSVEQRGEFGDIRAALFKLNDAGKSGSATRLRTARLYVAGSIVVAFSALFLLLYAICTPFSNVEDLRLMRFLVPLSFFLGITSVLSSGIFVLEVLVGRELKKDAAG
jgi:hypothetical protein